MHAVTLARWEKLTEWPLAALALAFLAAYAVPIVWPDSPAAARVACSVVIVGTWVIFAADYVTRAALAPNRWSFVGRNLPDLAAIVLPVIRPLRLLRLVMLLSILNRTGQHTLRGRVVLYVTGGTALLLVVGALAVTDAERGAPGATITNVGSAFWWALTTMTTVGYGDMHPVTPMGRGVAVGLMVGGIALLGVVTATLASWLVERVAAENKSTQSATRAQVEELTATVERLEAALVAATEQLNRSLPAPAVAEASDESPSTRRWWRPVTTRNRGRAAA